MLDRLPVVPIALAAALATAQATGPSGDRASAIVQGKGQRPAGASTSAVDLAGTDFVVLVWYRGDEALETFKY